MLGHSKSTTSQLLTTFSSTSSTCSSDHHNLGKGSCTGLFFQLFDWNGRLHKKQRLRRKSLPAGRPASPVLQDQMGESTEVLTEQNLNIVDLCSAACNLHTHGNDLSQREQTPPEKNKKKRSPNVVAKLMGLETMPSPDFRREKWPAHGYHHQSPLRIQNREERSLLSHSRIPSSRRSLMEIGSNNMDKSSSRWGSVSPCLSQVPSSMRHQEDVLQNNVDCDALLHTESARAMPSLASRMQDCKTGCILSPSNCHNKLSFPVKSPLASKAKTCLFEAANRILEPNRQLRVAVSESTDGNNENKNENATRNELNFKQASNSSASSCLYLQNTTPSPAVESSNGCSYVSVSSLQVASSKQRARSCSAVAENNEDVKTTQRLNRGHGIHADVDSSKCHQNQQSPGYGKGDKEKLCLRRQEHNSRQPSEGTSAKVQNAPPALGKRDNRGSSSHKIRGNPEQRGESQGTSSTSSMSSVLTQSSTNTSSGAMVKERGLSTNTGSSAIVKNRESSTNTSNTAKAKNREISSSRRANKTDKKAMTISNQVTPKMESSRKDSVSTRGVGTMSSQGCILKSKAAVSASTSTANRSVSQRSHSVIKGSVCTDRLNPVCEDDPPAESLSCNKNNFDDVVDARISSQMDYLFPTTVYITNDNLNTSEFTSDSRAGESGCGGSCVSSVEEIRDTAASCGIDGSHKRIRTVSYSGKSTATILQELLLALNPSRRPLENDNNSELSEITSRTTQTGECTSMEDHTKEDSFNSYINKEKGPGSISNMDDLSLGVSNDRQQHNCLDTMNCAQEGQVQSSDCELNKRKGELMVGHLITNQKALPKLTEYVFENEEDYVQCIVGKSNLTAEPEWRSSRNKFIVDPALFEELEKTTLHNWALQGMPEIEFEDWCTLNEEWYEKRGRDHRKLVFDCVQEALNLDVGISQQCSTPDLDYLQSQTHCQRVMRHLNNWRGVRCGMNVDDLVEKAMNTGSGKWDDFSDEFSGITEQVGHLLIDDLVDELVLDLSFSHQQHLTARTVEKLLEGSESKALIWVGL